MYLAKWHETLVAVKLLISLQDVSQVQDSPLSLSNPVLHNLQKASQRHPPHGRQRLPACHDHRILWQGLPARLAEGRQGLGGQGAAADLAPAPQHGTRRLLGGNWPFC